MAKIVIVGAGRVGVACAFLILKNLDHEVLIVDSNEVSLGVARDALHTLGVHTLDNNTIELRQIQETNVLEEELRKFSPYAVICCTPFDVNIQVAAICAKIRSNYIDFTEDVSVRKYVEGLNPTESAFVLQAGLAPGLITSIGLDLCDQLLFLDGAALDSLELRVGALPQLGTFPAAYSMTWSTAGLINEYLQPVEVIRDGEVQAAEPLDDHETLVANGQVLEAFNTSGGMGAPYMYLRIGLNDVTYKTLRYPGHLDFLKKSLLPELVNLSGAERITKGVHLANSLFAYTRQDVVHLIAKAVGVKGDLRFERSANLKFEPKFGLTALELTTAGHGVAVLELLSVADKTKCELTGIKFGGQFTKTQLLSTKVGARFM